MPGFELTIPPSPAWVDLTRGLVATGVSSLDFDIDRFSDLLVLTDLVLSEVIGHPGATVVDVSLTVTDEDLRMTFEAKGAVAGAALVSDLALSALAEDHWQSATDTGVRTGFTVSR